MKDHFTASYSHKLVWLHRQTHPCTGQLLNFDTWGDKPQLSIHLPVVCIWQEELVDGKEHFCHICQLYGKAELKKKN